MEDRFKMWLRLVIKSGAIDNDDIDDILTHKDKSLGTTLLNEFLDYDSTAAFDFVYDCIHDVNKEGKS